MPLLGRSKESHYSQAKGDVTPYDLGLRPLQNYITLKPLAIRGTLAPVFETPTKLHYSQTEKFTDAYNSLFETPTKLHYSQTLESSAAQPFSFETPTKLHYSQTLQPAGSRHPPFETPTKLHYSQTEC